jgi:hypothetical protein
MKVRARLRSILVAVGIAATLVVVAAAPAFATGRTCGSLCTTVYGNALHVDRVTLIENNAAAVYDWGHIQVRWHQGGVDHFVSSGDTWFSSQYETGINMNVNVDNNSYVCARLWVWNGSGYFLKFGDWGCIFAHS